MDGDPVGSLEQLKRDGTNIKQFGSCSRREKDGKTITNLGCEFWAECKWAREPAPDVEVDGVKGEPTLRPRNKRYVIVKTDEHGRRKVREGYCACFEFHQNFAKRDGSGGVVCKVTGTEGDSVRIRGSEKILATGAGQEPRWKPVFWTKTVPVFKPTQNDEIVNEQYATAIMEAAGVADSDEAVASSLKGEGVNVSMELDDEQVRKLISG